MTSLKRKQPTDFDVPSEFYGYLIQEKAENFAKTTRETVYYAQRTESIGAVWKALSETGISSAPVMLGPDPKHLKWFGFITLADITQYVVEHFTADSSKEKNTLQEWWKKAWESEEFLSKTVNDFMKWPLTCARPFHPIPKHYSAFSVMEALARDRGLHRVPILDEKRQIWNLVTQSKVAEFLQKIRNDNESKKLLGNKFNQPLTDCKQFFKPVVSVNQTEKAMDGFRKLVEHNVTGLAVVHEGKLVGTLSTRDLKVIAPDASSFHLMEMSVENFIQVVKTADLKAKYPYAGFKQDVKETQTLGDVLDLLSSKKVHRVFIVDDEFQPTGVVSLQDLLLELIEPAGGISLSGSQTG